ncbi:hypothetical protein [Methylocystis parvus]|uniref:Uncharacterized protein n=1 Tax=Methylocystis parvus TaxID=134 RepID=A0A6B8M6B6_9HYPH|nr:hypothetical protein [Methylocystis parvus]QGM96370.1 hypothetical protein F7D14_01955 [Methylocystis parvus]WBJ99789.1 hypothetical protein MMG94_17670 [Methylocystis parvus OBBP]
MRKGFRMSVGLACLIATTAGGDVLAKSHSRQSSSASSSISHNRDASFSRSLSLGGPASAGVERRSWLDPGTKVPVGSTNRYMLQQTYYNQDPVASNQRSWYMQETLPSRPPYNTDMIVPYNEGLELDWP